MAIVTRASSVLPCAKLKNFGGYGARTYVSNVMTLKLLWSSVQVQLCSLALAGSLFSAVRLPRDAFRYGPVPYLVAFTAASVVVALPVALLELAMGQLTRQDTVGVWRAVPILRGVGYLKIFTSCICCIYYMVPVALASAYLIWIGKGSFPLKDCTKLQMTPDGYENKMNASECFNSTFLAPFAAYPQYLGIMAIIIFVLWFFIPISLYLLQKTMKPTLAVCAPITLILASILVAAVGDGRWLPTMLPKPEQWRELLQPRLWHAALIQSLLSAQIKSGFLISSGGSVYYMSDVKWSAVIIVLESIVAGWVWVLVWVATGGDGPKDTTFVGVLVLIYQSAVKERRPKQWVLVAYAIVLFSGIITMITLLYPIFDRLQRIAGDRWRLMACIGSALGTALTLAVLLRGQNIMLLLDELAVPLLVVLTTTLEVVAFAFIYGWDSLLNDIEFLLCGKIRCFWVIGWWVIPFILLGLTGWWLRFVLKITWHQLNLSLWPLLVIFLTALAIIVIYAAMAVAKEEQYNLISKIAAAFRPSRLWGPEDPLSRYQWMSRRNYSDEQTSQADDTYTNHPQPALTPDEKELSDPWVEDNFVIKGPCFNNPAFEFEGAQPWYCERRAKSKLNSKNVLLDAPNDDDKLRSNGVVFKSKIPTLSEEVRREEKCKCKRHFSLRVPHYVNGEITTSL